MICGNKGFRGHLLAGINTSITGLPGREGKKERRGMWGHGILLPSPPPAAAEAEGGGEPAWETPSGARGPWSRAHPQQSTPGSLCGPTAIPAPAHRAQCTPPGRHPRQTYLPQHRPENQVPQPPGEDLARFAEREALWGGTRHREKAGQRPGRRRHRGKGTWGQRRGRTPKSEARFQGLAALLLKQRGPRAWHTTSRAGRIWF